MGMRGERYPKRACKYSFYHPEKVFFNIFSVPNSERLDMLECRFAIAT